MKRKILQFKTFNNAGLELSVIFLVRQVALLRESKTFILILMSNEKSQSFAARTFNP